jgi:hypothetical protein
MVASILAVNHTAESDTLNSEPINKPIIILPTIPDSIPENSGVSLAKKRKEFI